MCGAEVGESAKIEDVQTVDGTEIKRVHEGRRFRQLECAAFGKDGADELGTEVLIRYVQRDMQAAQEQSEDAVTIVFPTLKHIINKSFGTVINLIGHVHLQKGAGDIALFPVEPAVEVFLRQSGGKRNGRIFSRKTVKNGKFPLKRDGNMSKGFARKQSDEP